MKTTFDTQVRVGNELTKKGQALIERGQIIIEQALQSLEGGSKDPTRPQGLSVKEIAKIESRFVKK